MQSYFPFVPISADFIENYMIKANPNFVIIYIFLLNKSIQNISLNLDDISNKLNLLNSDVVRALKYWEEENLINYNILEESGVIQIQFLSGCNNYNNIDDVNIIQNTNNDVGSNINTNNTSTAIVQASNNNNIQATLDDNDEFCADIRKNQELGKIFTTYEKKLSKTLSQEDIRVLTYLYEDFGMTQEFFIMVLTYCIDKEITTIKYINTIAVDWLNNDVDSTEKVEAYLQIRTKTNFNKILGFLGITNRDAIKDEKDYMTRWLLKYNMPLFLIEEACKRAILSNKNFASSIARFNYIEGIIKKWSEKKVTNLDELNLLEEEFKASNKESYDKKLNNNSQQKYQSKTNNRSFNYSTSTLTDDVIDEFILESINSI